jgi:hypothetical protein
VMVCGVGGGWLPLSRLAPTTAANAQQSPREDVSSRSGSSMFEPIKFTV